MTTPDTQDRPIPSVPEGTPGRDWRAGLPAAQPPGAQQPWRRLGPGNRTWIVIITVLACVVLAVAAVTSLTFGAASAPLSRTGVVLLEPGQYRTAQSSCAGSGAYSSIGERTTVSFTAGDDTVEVSLRSGRLVQGACQLPFDLSDVNVPTDQIYQSTVGDLQATPVRGKELMGADTVVVQLAPR